jgi:hypothetical protein
VLRRGRREEIRVLLPQAAADVSMRLVRDLERFRREYAVRIVTQQLASNRERDVARTLDQFRRSLVVLPADAPVLEQGAAASVLESASAVLLVRA